VVASVGLAEMESRERELYMERVDLVREGFRRLGRGSQQRAAFDLRVSPSHVSTVVRAKYVDQLTLDRLEAWLTNELRPKPTAVVP
jgi:hypothetical protein